MNYSFNALDDNLFSFFIYILFKECKYALADATKVSISEPFPTKDLSSCSNLTVTSA